VHHGVSLAVGSVPGVKGGYFASSLRYPSEMAQTFWTAVAAFTTCFVVTVVGSLVTRARAPEALSGLVYSLTPRIVDVETRWYARPRNAALVVLALMVALNVIFF
jgi:SSS family solute:Na+ symporter